MAPSLNAAITYGSRMDLALARTDSKSHTLLANAALRHFSTIFAEITGAEIAATWSSSATPARRNRQGRFDSNALLRAFGVVVDLSIEGVKLAAAIKILTDDD